MFSCVSTSKRDLKDSGTQWGKKAWDQPGSGDGRMLWVADVMASPPAGLPGGPPCSGTKIYWRTQPPNTRTVWSQVRGKTTDQSQWCYFRWDTCLSCMCIVGRGVNVGFLATEVATRHLWYRKWNDDLPDSAYVAILSQYLCTVLFKVHCPQGVDFMNNPRDWFQSC